MANELELNIVILPDEKTKEIAIDLSRKVSETYQTDFVLDGRKKHPHISIYPARFPEKKFDSVVAYLKTIASRMAPFEVALGKFFNHSGFIWWNAELTNEFVHLHRAVLYQLNPLREGLILKAFQSGKFAMDETYNIQNYGYSLVGNLYQPHVTITHISNQQEARKVVEEMRPRIAKFIATKIAIGTLGDLGTLTEILEEFPFGGQSPYILKPQNLF